ncbi:MAG: hypothetical protein HY955_07360 [Deltaproteobacteria bacterium]|nr:hypothetical protein [Deltaproteobacteria bacterium]
MLRNKLALVAATAAVAALLFAPQRGYAVEEDPYIYKSLVGQVLFEFEESAAEQNGIGSESARFQQTYTLDLKGNFLSRRLLIYDAGVSFTNSDYSSDASDVTTRSTGYYFRTTALPKSAIPLSLYGQRTVDESSTAETIKTTYGLNWFLKLRTLPQTSLYAERTLSESEGLDTETGNYKVILKKDIGPTVNDATMQYSTSGSTDGTESSTATFNANNLTKISKSTQIYAGATLSRSASTETDSDANTSLEGLSLLLNSKPSEDFKQDHRYSYYRNSTDGDEQIGTTYSGDMGYKISKRADASLSVSLGTVKSDSSTSDSETESFGVGGGVNLRLTDNLMASESVSYSDYKTNANTSAASTTDTTDTTDTTTDTTTTDTASDTSATTGDRTTLRATSRLSYSKALSWAVLGAGWGLGYIEDKAEGFSTGQGLEHSFNASLGNIDVNKYVGFGAGFSRADTYTLAGQDIFSHSSNYNANAFNKLWKQYVLINASFNKSVTESYIDITGSKSETYRLDATSAYFKNFNLMGYAERSSTFSGVSGSGQNDSVGASVGHNRPLFKGSLSLSLYYTLMDTEFEGGSDTIRDLQFLTQYTRKFYNNLNWQATFSVTQKLSSESDKDTTSFTNSLTYPLRAWFLGLEQKNTYTVESNTETKEASLLFRATRVFVRVW